MSDTIESKKTTTWTNGERKITNVKVIYKDGRTSEYTINENEATSLLKYGLVLVTGILIGKKFF